MKKVFLSVIALLWAFVVPLIIIKVIPGENVVLALFIGFPFGLTGIIALLLVLAKEYTGYGF